MKFSMVIKIICSIIIMFAFFGCASTGMTETDETRMTPIANYYGVFDKNEMNLLRPAFINAVNSWLRRYTPRLIEQNQKYVKMTAKYDYELDIELFVKEEESEYEIIVKATNNYSEEAQTVCVKIGRGVLKAFTNELIRGTRVRDRTDIDGTR